MTAKTGRILIAAILAFALVGCSPYAVRAGRLLVDNPTVHNLSFRWLIDGDENVNAAVTMEYRRKGQADWRPALPMLRCGEGELNLFAGSVLNLEAGTSYEVRLTLTDPDGGGTVRQVLATTRAEPAENITTALVWLKNLRGGVR